MKVSQPTNAPKRLNHTALDLLAFVLVIIILYVGKPIIMPLLFAGILAVMVFPVQNFIEKKWHLKRLPASFFSILIITILAACFAMLLAMQFAQFIENGERYSENLGEVYDGLVASIEKTLKIDKGNALATSELDIASILRSNFDTIVTFLTESGAVMSDFVLVPIYTFFLLFYRGFFRKALFKMFKSHSKKFVLHIIADIYKIQQSYLLGLLKVILIVGVLNTAALLLLGIENAVFFGFFAAILLLIPYVGVVIGSILPALVALATKDSSWYAFGVVASFGFIQFVEGNFITPKITGSQVQMNPFIAILSLIAFALLWGIAGMVVALPVTATLKIIFDNTPRFKAYGFLIGQPTKEELTSRSYTRLIVWEKIRTSKVR